MQLARDPARTDRHIASNDIARDGAGWTAEVDDALRVVHAVEMQMQPLPRCRSLVLTGMKVVSRGIVSKVLQIGPQVSGVQIPAGGAGHAHSTMRRHTSVKERGGVSSQSAAHSLSDLPVIIEDLRSSVAASSPERSVA